MNWDCSLIMRSSIGQEPTAPQKFPKLRHKQNSGNTNSIDHTGTKDQKHSLKRAQNQFSNHSKQMKKKTSLKVKNSSSKTRFHTQQMEYCLEGKNCEPFTANGFIPSTQSNQTSRPESRMYTQYGYNRNNYFQQKITHYQTPNQNKYMDNFPVTARGTGFCSPGIKRPTVTCASLHSSNGFKVSHQAATTTKVSAFCPTTRIYSPQYEQKGGKMVIKQFNQPKPRPVTKTTILINVGNSKSSEMNGPKHKEYANQDHFRFANQNRHENQQRMHEIRQPEPMTKGLFWGRTQPETIVPSQSIIIKQPKESQSTLTINLSKHNRQTLEQSQIEIYSNLKQTRQTRQPTIATSAATTVGQSLPGMQLGREHIQIFKCRRKIEDFLTYKEQIKSVRDSDDISQECSQVVATFEDIVKQHGKVTLNT